MPSILQVVLQLREAFPAEGSLGVDAADRYGEVWRSSPVKSRKGPPPSLGSVSKRTVPLKLESGLLGHRICWLSVIDR